MNSVSIGSIISLQSAAMPFSVGLDCSIFVHRSVSVFIHASFL